MSYESECAKNRERQDFLSDLHIAKKAEILVAEWLDYKQFYDNVKMVGQEIKEHDLECIKGDKKITIEVKRDFWTDELPHRKASNNICIEIWSHFMQSNPGWYFYTDAMYVFYLSNKYLYVLSMDALRAYIPTIVNFGTPGTEEPFLLDEENKDGIRITSAYKNGNFNVRNLMINKDILEKNHCIIKKYDREEVQLNVLSKKYDI